MRPCASLAQLVEQLTLNQFVRGSSPRRCTILVALATFFMHKSETLTPDTAIRFVRLHARTSLKGESPIAHPKRITRTLNLAQSSCYFLVKIGLELVLILKFYTKRLRY